MIPPADRDGVSEDAAWSAGSTLRQYYLNAAYGLASRGCEGLLASQLDAHKFRRVEPSTGGTPLVIPPADCDGVSVDTAWSAGSTLRQYYF